MNSWEECDLRTYWRLREEKKLTSLDLCSWYLERIANYDSYYKSILEINPDALFLAEAMDRELEQGRKRSLLHGVPILLKDSISTKDLMHTSAGSLALKDHFAKEDAFIVSRLREAGAILLGKTNMTEFAHYTSRTMKNGYSSRGGQVMHPYNPSSSPSGSSTGSAVAMSCNFGMLSLGTETKGSIIWPSHNSSIVGIKPTRGLISRTGIIPICRAHDTAGPMARTVEDCAYLLSVLAEEDPDDPSTWALDDKRFDYSQFLHHYALDGMRIGIKKTTFKGEELALFNEALETMRGLGAQFIDEYELDEVGPEDQLVLQHEFKRSLEHYLHESAAPYQQLDEIIAFNKQHPAALVYGQDLLEDALEVGDRLMDPAYLHQRTKVARGVQERIERLLDEEKLDLLLFPGRSDLPSVSGLPCIVVPCGYTSENRPLGISFMGRAFDEGRLIAAAYSYEQASKKRKPPVLRKED